MSVHNNSPYRASIAQLSSPVEEPPDESFAPTTYLRMDKDAFDQLKERFKASEIASWIGRRFRFGNKASISIRDARLINQNAGIPIFEIDENHLTQFKVTESARLILQRLGRTHDLSEPCRKLKLYPTFLHSIKGGRTVTISKENADKIEQHFGIDVFGMHQIFEHARTENIDSVMKKQEVDNPGLLTFIECDDKSRKKVKKLDSATKPKIAKFIGNGIYNDCHSTPVRNAVIINKISKSEIFSFSVQKLVTVPYSRETCAQLNELIEKKIKENVSFAEIARNLGPLSTDFLRVIRKRENGKLAFITAQKINNYFGKRLFDFEKVLNEALADADHFYETFTQRIASTKKRKNRDTEEETQPPKKQKTDPIEHPIYATLDEQQPLVGLGNTDDFSDFLSNEDDFWGTTPFEDTSSSYSAHSSPGPLDAEIDSFFS